MCRWHFKYLVFTHPTDHWVAWLLKLESWHFYFKYIFCSNELSKKFAEGMTSKGWANDLLDEKIGHDVFLSGLSLSMGTSMNGSPVVLQFGIGFSIDVWLQVAGEKVLLRLVGFSEIICYQSLTYKWHLSWIEFEIHGNHLTSDQFLWNWCGVIGKKKVLWLLMSRCFITILLTHWGRDKMAAIFQMTFPNAFS